jgi:hypothetical protein
MRLGYSMVVVALDAWHAVPGVNRVIAQRFCGRAVSDRSELVSR